MLRKLVHWLIGVVITIAAPSVVRSDQPDVPTAASLGQRLFFDTRLSRPAGQGCVSCHQPAKAFADPRPVSPGAVAGRTGKRNSPSLMYAALIPGFVYEDFQNQDGQEVFAFEGGLFLDGRAKDLFDQVRQPFFDPNEMNLPDESALASRIRGSPYADEFHTWVGDLIWEDDVQLTYNAYRALVEFLKQPFFRPFDARIDDYLAGKEASLTESEKRGLEIFRGSGGCVDCHPLTPIHWSKPLMSDFGFDNLGVPSRGKPDPGLAGHTGNQDELGQFRSPSLRNVKLTAPYMHNGSIATLRQVMEFYNQRDVDPKRWGPTDYPQTVNRRDMGNLKLSEQQIGDLVALMDAFTDKCLLKMNADDLLPTAPPTTPTTSQKRLFFPDWTHRMHQAFPGPADGPEPNRTPKRRVQ